jgi:hypothetical protein
MRTSFVTSAVITFSLILTQTTFAENKSKTNRETTAQSVKKPKRPSGNDIKSTTGGAIALTAAECTGIGGRTQPNLGCFPHQACFTVDPVGVIRKVCLTGN